MAGGKTPLAPPAWYQEVPGLAETAGTSLTDLGQGARPRAQMETQVPGCLAGWHRSQKYSEVTSACASVQPLGKVPTHNANGRMNISTCFQPCWHEAA